MVNGVVGLIFLILDQKLALTDGGQENFIPTNLKLGGGFDFILDDFNTISTNLRI